MITQYLGDASGVVFWARGTKDYDSGKFGLKQTTVHSTCFVNAQWWQKVLVLGCGLYIAPLGMVFCISQSYTSTFMCTKFGLIWIKLASTSFRNVQLDQICKVDASLA